MLAYKRLETGKFDWPRNEAEVREMTPQQFRWLMEGLSIDQKKSVKKLDSALMRAGRFDTKIYIPMPDEASRKELFADSLGKIPHNLDLDFCAGAMEGYSCADIVGVANNAKEFFVKRSISSHDDIPLSVEDFRQIISKVKPSVPKTELDRYEKMRSIESFL